MTLEELRALIGHKDLPDKTLIRSADPIRSLPVGALSEISGWGKTQFLVDLMKSNPDFDVAWVERTFSLYPVALTQQGINLKKLLLIEDQHHTLWTLSELIQSGLFEIVVVRIEFCALKDLRRLQLMCEKHSTALIFLKKQLSNTWPFTMSLDLQKSLSEASPNHFSKNLPEKNIPERQTGT